MEKLKEEIHERILQNGFVFIIGYKPYKIIKIGLKDNEKSLLFYWHMNKWVSLKEVDNDYITNMYKNKIDQEHQLIYDSKAMKIF